MAVPRLYLLPQCPFVASFPWFNSDAYWEGQILGLREQAAILDEEPLEPDWLEL